MFDLYKIISIPIISDVVIYFVSGKAVRREGDNAVFPIHSDLSQRTVTCRHKLVTIENQ
jgi:hypothetical protein